MKCPRCGEALQEHVYDSIGNATVRLDTGAEIHRGCLEPADKPVLIRSLDEWLPVGKGITCPRCFDRLKVYAAFAVENPSVRLKSGEIIHNGCVEVDDVVTAVKIRDEWLVKREDEGRV